MKLQTEQHSEAEPELLPQSAVLGGRLDARCREAGMGGERGGSSWRRGRGHDVIICA